MIEQGGRHVVLGAGAIGLAVVEELVSRGRPVSVVSRSGTPPRDEGVRAVVGDVSDLDFARHVCAEAAVVYHCVNPPYQKWETLFPPLHATIVEAAGEAGARLVMADNLYMYGRPSGRPMAETSPSSPATSKGGLRMRMAQDLLAAHDQGRVQAVIGRASDYFGPNGLASHMGERVFPRLLEGKKAQVLGDPDTLHTYTYLPDIGRALATLGERDEALGQVWHIPSPAAVSTRRFIEMIGEESGRAPGISVMPPALLTVLSWINPLLGAVRDELYQLQNDWVMDDSKYRMTFREAETPIARAIAATVAWFRDNPRR